MNEDIDITKKEIQNIVISGGGVNGFSYLGILEESEKQGIWNIDNIQSIWGTSAGALLAVLVALNHDWITINDYFIKRPWQNVFKYDLYSIFTSNRKCGIFDQTHIYDSFKPLFLSKNIDININMRDFFTITNIDIHIIVTNINSFNLIDISHKTHPLWKVMDAVYASAAVPIIFKPLCIENQMYCDGFFNSNYPIGLCIDSSISTDSIMGICSGVNDLMREINNDTSLFDYIIFIIVFIIFNFIHKPIPEYILHTEYKLQSATINDINSFMDAINEQDERKRLIQVGRDIVHMTTTTTS